MKPGTPVLAGFCPLFSEAHETGDSAGTNDLERGERSCSMSLRNVG
jgi:hypothetical protein